MPSDIQNRLITQMRQPAFYPHPTAPQITLLQTHISFVLLTGTYAYKVKKALKLDFLDYSTLEQRERFCREELRLNRRGAPEIYLDVLPITLDGEALALNGQGKPVDYVVKMRQFPQECLMNNLLANGGVGTRLADLLGRAVAQYHKTAPVSVPANGFGDMAHVTKLLDDNLVELQRWAGDCPTADQLRQIEQFARQFLQLHREAITGRANHGFIRECHGDLHLRNICFWQDRLEFFDCIEFDDNLRNVDVMYDIAFALIDFDIAGRLDLRSAFLNAYLEQTGDWEGLRVLPYYLCRQAVVRGKVQSLQAGELPTGSAEAEQAQSSARRYFSLACRYAQPRQGCIAICCGISGSGKSTLARALAAEVGAVQIRSDAVRKHLAGIPLEQHGGKEVYSANMTQQTYSRLRELGVSLADSGNVAILDATYSSRQARQELIQNARTRGIPLHIVLATAPPEVLERRLSNRRGDISDATSSLLSAQVAKFESLSPDEEPLATRIDTAQSTNISAVVEWVNRQVRRRASGIS